MEAEPLLRLGSLEYEQLIAKREDFGMHRGLSAKTGNGASSIEGWAWPEKVNNGNLRLQQFK
jgi:hypothetical protein